MKMRKHQETYICGGTLGKISSVNIKPQEFKPTNVFTNENVKHSFIGDTSGLLVVKGV